MFSVSLLELVTRLLLATVLAGVIGFNREQNSHPAGMRTHILVCLGACVIAMIQQQIGAQTIAFAMTHKDIYEVIRADPARLIAQVVSGIGFLGAGTIITTRHNISGLTTAASLWATAGIGLAVGMGYYSIAVGGAISVFIVLTVLKRAIKIKPIRRLEVKYVDREDAQKFIKAYFAKRHIIVHGAAFSTEHVVVGSHEHLYKHIYRIELPRKLDYAQLIDDLSQNDNIRTARMITL
jgi:putative Mg2+ transporter-C (MgtC) family protein